MVKKSFLASILVCTTFLGLIGLGTPPTVVNGSEFVELEKPSKEFDLNSEEIVVSEVMTREETIQSISEEFNISKEQVEQNIFKDKERIHGTENSANYILVRAFQDFQINNSVEGGTAYFYCEISASGGFRAIKEIIYAGFNHPQYQYSGTLQYGLPDPNRIHYTLNGNLYNHTTTSVSGGGSVGLFGTGSLNYNVSSTSSYIRNVFVTRNVYF